jgi:hypothetical protein
VNHDHREDDRHIHFINVLETVQEILRPLAEKAASKREKGPETPEQKLVNIFEALDVNDPAPVAPDSSAAPSAKPSQTAKAPRSYDVQSTHDEVLLSSISSLTTWPVSESLLKSYGEIISVEKPTLCQGILLVDGPTNRSPSSPCT